MRKDVLIFELHVTEILSLKTRRSIAKKLDLAKQFLFLRQKMTAPVGKGSLRLIENILLHSTRRGQI